MKTIAANIAAYFVLFWCVHGITGQAFDQGIRITQQCGQIHCETLICPSRAVECHVIRRNDPYVLSNIVSIRKCVGPSGSIFTSETEIHQKNLNPQDPVNSVVIWRLGFPTVVRQLTQAEELEFQRELSRTKQEGRSEVASAKADVQSAMEQVHDAVEPFESGSFFENLRQRISSDVKKNLDFGRF